MFKSAYSAKERVRTLIEGPSMTKQSFKDACDINHMIAKYQTINQSEFLRDAQGFCEGVFGDVSIVPQYQEALNLMMDAEEAFDSLPSNVRERFLNNPEQMLQFLSDDSNRDEAVKLGLLSPPPPSNSTLPVEKSA